MRLALLFAAALSAYAAGLTTTPSTVSWTYVSGSHDYPSSTIALLSANGATAYSAIANSENGWLLVNAAYISSSATISAGAYLTTAGPIERLDSGSYQGTINMVDSNGNTAAVTVNLTISGGVIAHPGITVSPAALTFTSTLNGPPQTQNVTVTGPTAGLLQVQAAGGSLPGWLQAVVTGSAGTYVVVITATPANLGTGGYRETLLLSIGIATASLPVVLTIQQPSVLVATPSSVTFDYTPGGAPPQPAIIGVTSNTGVNLPFFASANVQNGNWLAVVGGGSTPGTVTVTPQVADLAPGFYGGNVLITPQQGAPLIVPVSLTLRPTPVISVSAGSLSFSYRTGDAVPPPLTVQVAGGGASALFGVQVSGGDWLTATPARPAAPTLLTVGVKPATLPPGSYQGTVTLTGTGTAKGIATITVVLQVLDSKTTVMTVDRVTDAAGYQEGGVAPGEMITIFGSGLAPAGIVTLALDSAGKVATTLNGVQVLFNGTPAPLVYISPGQIAAVAPYELDGRAQTTIQVNWNGQVSNSVLLPVVATAPGIFTADASGTGPAAAITQPGVITLYLTGEGQTVPPGITGKVTTVSAVPPLTPAPAAAISVMVGGQPANFTFAGEAPGIVSGVLQLNVTIPPALGPGTYPVSVAIGGKLTQSGVLVRW